MKTYIYVLHLIPRLLDPNAWTKEENQLVNDHFIRLKNDHQNGIVILAGKTVLDSGFGLVIFRAQSEQLALDYMNNDPAVKGKIMTAELHEYRVAII